MVKLKIKDFNIKIFADGADAQGIYDLNKKDYVKVLPQTPP